MKKYIKDIIVLLIAAVIICFIPFPASGVNLWFYFESIDETDMEEDAFKAYYTTDEYPNVSESQSVIGKYDKENKRVVFRFNKEEADSINSLRIDWPAKEQTLIINNVSVSSGGAIRKNLDPSRIIDENNISYMNDITALSAIKAKCRTYIATGDEDPYILLGADATAYLMKQQSRHIISRCIMMLFVVLGLICYRKIEW